MSNNEYYDDIPIPSDESSAADYIQMLKKSYPELLHVLSKRPLQEYEEAFDYYLYLKDNAPKYRIHKVLHDARLKLIQEIKYEIKKLDSLRVNFSMVQIYLPSDTYPSYIHFTDCIYWQKHWGEELRVDLYRYKQTRAFGSDKLILKKENCTEHCSIDRLPLDSLMAIRLRLMDDLSRRNDKETWPIEDESWINDFNS